MHLNCLAIDLLKWCKTIQGNFSLQWPVASLTSRNKPCSINSLWWTSLFVANVSGAHQTPAQSGGSSVSSRGCCPAVAQEQWCSVFQGLTSFSECFKCWLCVLGSLKKFLFPSCCSERFCSCLLRKSPALASEQQWVGDVISNVHLQNQTRPPSLTTKEQTLLNCILISRNTTPSSNPWLLYKIQRICKEPPQKSLNTFCSSFAINYGCIFSCLSSY